MLEFVTEKQTVWEYLSRTEKPILLYGMGVQPGAESLETFGKVACRAVGYADDIRVARLAQSQHIPFPFGDNQARNILFGNQQRVDTVDVVRRARRGEIGRASCRERV